MLRLTGALRSALCAFALMAIAHVGARAEEAPNFADSTLTGDWGGARTAAWHNGVQWEAGLKLDVLNGSNRDRSATRSVSHIDLKLRTDLEKMFGWTDAVAYLNVIDDRGNGSNAHAGTLMGISNIEVPVSTTRLFNAWVQKGFFDDRFSVLAGIYPIDSEFFTLDSATTLLHPAYGTPADLALTHVPSVFNSAALGLRAKWYSPDRTVYAMGALMDGVPNDPAHPKATTVRFARNDGAFVIAELGWMPLEYGHAFEPTDPAVVRQSPALTAHEKYGGLSKYALGFWRYTSRRDDLVDVGANGQPVQRRSQGGYALAERTLWHLGSDQLRNVTAFARYTFADPNTIAIDRSWNLGGRVRGPLASRPQDTLAIGWTRGQISDKYRSLQANPGAAEVATELSWRIELSHWLAIQPDLQRIRHAGGNASASPVTVVGARFEVIF